MSLFYGHGCLIIPSLTDIAAIVRAEYQPPLEALSRYCWPGRLRRRALVHLEASLMCGVLAVRLQGSPEQGRKR